MSDTKIKLNIDENVTFYVVEENDEPAIYTAEQQAEIDKKNDAFIDGELQERILNTMDVCKCRMPEFMSRNERTRQILNIPPNQYRPSFTQEDLDAFHYGVIVVSKNDVVHSVAAIVRECKTCHKIEYWGDAVLFSRLLAETTTNYMSSIANAENDHESTNDSEYAVEEIEDNATDEPKLQPIDLNTNMNADEIHEAE